MCNEWGSLVNVYTALGGCKALCKCSVLYWCNRWQSCQVPRGLKRACHIHEVRRRTAKKVKYGWVVSLVRTHTITCEHGLPLLRASELSMPHTCTYEWSRANLDTALQASWQSVTACLQAKRTRKHQPTSCIKMLNKVKKLCCDGQGTYSEIMMLLNHVLDGWVGRDGGWVNGKGLANRFPSPCSEQLPYCILQL